MMAAEKWHEYQTSYHKYGLEMRPTQAKVNKTEEKPVRSVICAKDKARLMLLTVFVGLLCFCLIISAAYSAQVKYNINGLLAQSDSIQGEIENLNVALKSATCITVIEEKATTQLGMVYPAVDQVAYIDRKGSEIQDFALTLKVIAYNH
jgi:cell division protein FtsL